MALDLGASTRVEALEMAGGSDERFALLNTVRWSFPARHNLPPVAVHWCDGYKDGVKPTADKEHDKSLHHRPAIVAEVEKKYGVDFKGGGSILRGRQGIMSTVDYCEGPCLLPLSKHKEYPPARKEAAALKGGHFVDFFRGCKGRPRLANFDYAGPLTEMVFLGCLAERAGVGKHVQWDAEKMEVTKCRS